MRTIDVESRLVSWIGEQLDVEAGTEVPAERPTVFVAVERVGGARTNFVDCALVTVRCWALTRSAASDLAARVDAALARFVNEPGIVEVKRASLRASPQVGGNGGYELDFEIKTVVEAA